MPSKIGFIALGTMGSRMAKNLLKAGYKLIVYNRSSYSVEEMMKLGATSAASPELLARECRVTILSLPAITAVDEAVLGNRGLIHGLSSDSIVIDTSTIDPESAVEIAQAIKSKKCYFLDAQVSGGPEGAESGTLSIMVGGDVSAFESCKEILEKIGKSIFYIGESGSGQKIKLVNQALCGAYFVVVAEAFQLAQKMNLKQEDLLKVISRSWGDSPVFRHFISVINSQDYTDGAKINLYRKDLSIVTAISKKYKLPMPALELALRYYSKASELGFDEFDASYLSSLPDKALLSK